MFGHVFSNFWTKFGDDKKLNFAKALAEYLAEKLSIPIANSASIVGLRKMLEKHFGTQMAETGEDALTILAKVFLHAPDRFIVFLSTVTGRPKGEVTVVVNQFLDELAKGIIKNDRHINTPAEAKQALVEAATLIDAAPAREALEQVLNVTYAYDTRRKDVHYIGCDEVNEYVNVKEEGGGDDKGGDKGKRGPRKVKKLKAHIRELTLGDLLEFGIDPLGFRPGCCGGVKASDMSIAKGGKATSETKPLSFRLCLAGMGQEGLEIMQRVQTVLAEWSQDLLAPPVNPMNAGVLPVSKERVEEVRDDYLMRSIWTPDLVRLFMKAWNPIETQSRFIKLSCALECLHGIAPATPKPKPVQPSKLDKVVAETGKALTAYIKGEDSPGIDAVRTRVDQVTTGFKTKSQSSQERLRRARLIDRQGK